MKKCKSCSTSFKNLSLLLKTDYLSSMRTEQRIWTAEKGWDRNDANVSDAQLVLIFIGIEVENQETLLSSLKISYPNADLVFCSTAGEIAKDEILDNSAVCTAIHFNSTPIKIHRMEIHSSDESESCGIAIANALSSDDLKGLFIISEGTITNGDFLVKGVNENIPSHVLVTGGLAGDAGRFTQTFVGVNEIAKPGIIAAIGFYGDQIEMSHGSQGGWSEFGPIRTVTSSDKNVLYTLDNGNALELYKRYLGERAEELPGAALLFPLCIIDEDGSQLVRTILSIDEEKGSMTFAGNIPNGSRVQFMMANFEHLIEGAEMAAAQNGNIDHPTLAILISCVGRRIVLGQRTEEELDAVIERIGYKTTYCGFYSNGEISPLRDRVSCALHNQTMTITTFKEKGDV
jgi:hypothetical protein